MLSDLLIVFPTPGKRSEGLNCPFIKKKNTQPDSPDYNFSFSPLLIKIDVSDSISAPVCMFIFHTVHLAVFS